MSHQCVSIKSQFYVDDALPVINLELLRFHRYRNNAVSALFSSRWLLNMEMLFLLVIIAHQHASLIGGMVVGVADCRRLSVLGSLFCFVFFMYDIQVLSFHLLRLCFNLASPIR